MKTVIRYGIFESNSSSEHSICITKNDRHVGPKDFIYDGDYPEDYVYLNKDGELSFLNDVREGYGRYPFKILTTVEDKLQYAMCSYLGRLYPDDPEFEKLYNMFDDMVREIIPGCTGLNIHKYDFDLYTDVDGNEILRKDLKYDHWDKENDITVYYYLDKNGNKQIAKLNEETYMDAPEIGAIDHQSNGLLQNFLKDKNIDLKEFLTNKKYVVVIDGDELQDFRKYLKSGFINKDFITEIYGNYGADPEFQEWLEEQN